ncbi:MAG: recombination regulator RecX [Leptospirales bacterium]|nr:recombination regulator RecX [Leptospirales bacterium]
MLFDPGLKELLERVLPRLEPYLAVRERSSGEVRDRLRLRKLCEAEERDRIIDYLASEGMINDRRFTANRVRYRLDNGYGPAFIRDDLHKLKVERAVVDECLRDLGPEAIQLAAQKAALKAARQARDPLKLVGRLMRRGFSMNDLRGIEALDGLPAAMRDRAARQNRRQQPEDEL